MTESIKPTGAPPSKDTSLDYWLQTWKANRIGFHRSVVSELFQSYLIPKLTSTDQRKCVVFPLCGKTLDMVAVLDAGHTVIGFEGASSAVEAFFNENKIPYETENDESNQCQTYKGKEHPVIFYCTNFFTFKKPLPSIDYIWDRGALVAISPESREQYRDCLYRMMTPERTQLFEVAVSYDDPEYSPPPHIVSDDDINRLFGSECSIELLKVHDETEEFNAKTARRPVRQIEERLHLIVRKQK